ncbi:hypothetical protein CEXT_158151 [Caerostris extrusa]|uniref:Uncharacterized protein n=1 Tax=Caerostris extrusa TaxID=172846 RepID=A0AAV4XE58_CAEEX|nr:hypothetical protein CEXT_158151 [Caerostris extrusa]
MKSIRPYQLAEISSSSKCSYHFDLVDSIMCSDKAHYHPNRISESRWLLMVPYVHRPVAEGSCGIIMLE